MLPHIPQSVTPKKDLGGAKTTKIKAIAQDAEGGTPAPPSLRPGKTVL